jgi:hypothetical protein
MTDDSIDDQHLRLRAHFRVKGANARSPAPGSRRRVQRRRPNGAPGEAALAPQSGPSSSSRSGARRTRPDRP